ncbi:hypothetical protein [Qipengyuania sp. JC766]|uniref:hypothetical protein n=1 Tax=Qipengyuania sp. JC766 TaxID=3232139 RepID=UPI00345A37BE
MTLLRATPSSAAALALAGLAAACQPATTGEDAAVGRETTPAPAASTPAPSPSGPATTPATSTVAADPGQTAFDCAPLRQDLTPEAMRSETGARSALIDWSAGLEYGRYDTAWCQFADSGAASGMTRAEFTRYWSAFDDVRIAVPGGRMEGAAGTSYYTVPTTVTATDANGNPVRFEGEVILRRVNDVPGASEEQLRWLFRSADLKRVAG